mgnify:CR=1 FL=1
MLAKYWKRIGLIILIIACLFNITFKLVNKTSLKKELETSGQYILEHEMAVNICYDNKQHFTKKRKR